MKRNSLIIVLLIVICLFITGCDNDKNKVISNGEKVNTASMKHLHCTRKASAGEGITVKLSNDVYYTGENIDILYSKDKVTSNNQSSLDSYEEAYNKIKEHYEGLEYYDQVVTRDENSVTNEITINYDKINMKKLLKIEGEEDNIIKDGKAKLDTWLSLAKKLGTTCKEVEK